MHQYLIYSIDTRIEALCIAMHHSIIPSLLCNDSIGFLPEQLASVA